MPCQVEGLGSFSKKKPQNGKSLSAKGKLTTALRGGKKGG
jgi:hypothetical protein